MAIENHFSFATIAECLHLFRWEADLKIFSIRDLEGEVQIQQ